MTSIGVQSGSPISQPLSVDQLMGQALTKQTHSLITVEAGSQIDTNILTGTL